MSHDARSELLAALSRFQAAVLRARAEAHQEPPDPWLARTADMLDEAVRQVAAEAEAERHRMEIPNGKPERHR